MVARAREPMPIDAVLAQLVAALRSHRSVVLRAPTGAGKTTRVAPAILDASLSPGQVVLVEPRRVAARAAARRIAFERGCEVGAEVGYHVRFDAKSGADTRIVAMTEGILVRRLQDDPFLDGVAAVVFDEFHERHLDADLALAMVARIRREVRSDLAVVVMSATIEPAPIAAYLGDCPIVSSEGRLHPVSIRHAPMMQDQPLEREIVGIIRDLLDERAGDLLVFLPGVGEIRRCRAALEGMAHARRVELVDLYGDLPPERQDRAIRRGAGRRIVLATNVAESSVTVEGVTAVVDSGLARVLRFEPAIGIDRLELARICRASADQRAGRAGRNEPGVCVRLWSEHEDGSLRPDEEPEIRRVDLSRAVLELHAWGERDLEQFPWLEPPPRAALAQADRLLRSLGALDAEGITEIGRAMVRLPLPTRIARMLVEGRRLGGTRRIATAAALLAERDPFRRVRNDGSMSGFRGLGPAHAAWESDVLERVERLERLERQERQQGRNVRGRHIAESPSAAGGDSTIDAGAVRAVLRARDQLVRILDERVRVDAAAADASVDADESVLRALLAAFPDRLARRREPGSGRAVMVGGRGVRLADQSYVASSELFVCVDVDAGRRGERSEALVRLASAVERTWLAHDQLRLATSIEFDPRRLCVTAVARTAYRDLVLDEKRVAVDDDERATRVLVDAAAGDLRGALSLDAPDVVALRARVEFLRAHMPELELPLLDDERLTGLLPRICGGSRSFEDLRKLPLVEILRGELGHAHGTALDNHAPQALTVPSGSRVRLLYDGARPPVLAARIQELFGLTETPRVAAGRVAVLVHLLAPNGRPQQVTDDLASFWNTTYQQVRKELRQRYPRHAWPEDPWNAPAERRPARRKIARKPR